MKYASLLQLLLIKNLINPISAKKRCFEGRSPLSQKRIIILIMIAVADEDAVFRFYIFSFSFLVQTYYFFYYYYWCCYLLRCDDVKTILSWASTALLNSFPLPLHLHPRSCCCCSSNLKFIMRSLTAAIFVATTALLIVSTVTFSLDLLGTAACHHCSSSQTILPSLLSLNFLLDVTFLCSCHFQQLFPLNCHCFICSCCSFLHRRYAASSSWRYSIYSIY